MNQMFASGSAGLINSLDLARPLDLTASLDLASSLQPALIVAQVSKWLPTWVTPIWVISAGLILGAIACIAVYGVLALLSFVPGLGTLPDSTKSTAR